MATARISRLQGLRLASAFNWLPVRAHSTKVPVTAMGHMSHVHKVVSTSDGSAFVAWHPTTEFPYEYSRPVPPPAVETSTLIKDEAIEKAMSAFTQKNENVARQELMKITHTHIICWVPPKKTGRKGIKRPRDRQYL